MTVAQAARLELARKGALPDVEVSVQYGRRPGLTDMISATVSVPIPLQRHRKQDQLVADADAQLASLHEALTRCPVDDLEPTSERTRSTLSGWRTLAGRSTLPDGLDAPTAQRLCEQRGALVSGGQGFAVPGTSTPNGLRLALGGELDPAHTLEGVKIVAEVLASLSFP